MNANTDFQLAYFSVGELVQHRRFNYRGVIFDIDPDFQSSDEWYETMAKSKPPKDKPWYHVLVNNAVHTTYVAERNLEPDTSGKQIKHPMLEHFFADFENGRYVIHSQRTN